MRASAWSRTGRGLRLAWALGALLLAPARLALAQSVQLQLESRELYAGMPFEITAVVEGFEEQPPPEQPRLEVAGCQVTPVGVAPNVSTMIQIINGRHSEERRVTWALRYRVTAPAAGTYRVAALTVVQGPRRAQSRPSNVRIGEIARTRDMQIRLNLPPRPVLVGETLAVSLDWLLRRDVGEQRFVVPLFEKVDAFEVNAAPAAGRRQLALMVGSRQLELPYDRDAEVIDGVQYTRIRLHALVTPLRSGTIEIPPAVVSARIASGSTRDFFGFRQANYSLAKAEDVPRRLEVTALPQKDRPQSFSDAVGSAFALTLRASRTVVRVGDPIELQITLRGKARLEGLRLPRLDAAGLDPQIFAVPADAPPGEIIEDGKAKLFRVSVRLKAAAREIPRLAFSYFDAEKRVYETVHSEPIALQVAGTAVVGAGDVVATPARPTRGAGSTPKSDRTASLVGADLSLSAEGRALRRPFGLGRLGWLLGFLYGVPVLVLAMRLWHLRTGARRGQERELRRALRELARELERAATTPARDAAPRLLVAVRALVRLVGRAPDGAAVIADLEDVSYDPSGGAAPVSPSLLARVRHLTRDGARAPRASGSGPGPITLLLLLGAAALVGGRAASADGPESQLRAVRQIYGVALTEVDRGARTRAFAEAEARLGELVAAYPDRPELLCDAGNAALGAQNLGHAVLAYRRALVLDPTLERARRNLAWARGRLPEPVPGPQAQGAFESLFFWHHRLTLTERHGYAALAFALGVVLWLPWPGRPRRQRLGRRLSVVAAALWLALVASALLERGAGRDGVLIQDGVSLRSADSHGAAPTLATPLPAGTEVRLLEARPGWTRVTLANGTSGWVPSGAVAAVSAGGS